MDDLKVSKWYNKECLNSFDFASVIPNLGWGRVWVSIWVYCSISFLYYMYGPISFHFHAYSDQLIRTSLHCYNGKTCPHFWAKWRRMNIDWLQCLLWAWEQEVLVHITRDFFSHHKPQELNNYSKKFVKRKKRIGHAKMQLYFCNFISIV